jgi:hypothetical protein
VPPSTCEPGSSSGGERTRSKNDAFGQNSGAVSAPPWSSQRRHSSEFRHRRHRRLAAAKAAPRPSRAAEPGSPATRCITSPMSRACRSTRAAIGHAAALFARGASTRPRSIMCIPLTVFKSLAAFAGTLFDPRQNPEWVLGCAVSVSTRSRPGHARFSKWTWAAHSEANEITAPMHPRSAASIGCSLSGRRLCRRGEQGWKGKHVARLAQPVGVANPDTGA